MGLAKKSSKRRPRSDDPEFTSGHRSKTPVMDVEYDYPHDETPSSSIKESMYTPADTQVYSLNNLVDSWKSLMTETVVLPDAVETQLSQEQAPRVQEEEEVLDVTVESDDDDDDSAVPPPPAPPVMAKGVDDDDVDKSRPCPRKYYVGGVLLALVCIAAIVVVSLIAPDNSTPKQVSSSATGGTTTPTYSGPPASRQEAFSRLIAGLSTEDSFVSQNSPQSKALDWLVNYDSAQLDPQVATQREVQERYILGVFYYSTGGTNWFDSFYFLSQNHVCNWRNADFGMGVSCDDSTKTVNGFKFGPNNLQGTLPDELFLLQGLETLQIIMNPGLTGSIPSTVGSLTNLEVLNFNKNSLTGTIPDELLSLPSLTTLWMDENSFEGSIPTIAEVGSETLQWWSCNNCGLTGRMPDELRVPSFLI